MNRYEKDEISCLPAKYRPMTVWSYIGYSILFSLALVGFICVLVFSFNRGNICRRSYARFWLLLDILIFLLIGAIVLVLYLTGMLDVIFAMIQEMIPMP